MHGLKMVHQCAGKKNEYLLTKIMDIFEKSKETYGSPRITEELRASGERLSKNRVADIMRAAEIRARKPRKFSSFINAA